MKKKMAPTLPFAGFIAQGFDGEYALVYAATDKPVLKNDTVRNFRDEDCGKVTSIEPPRHEASSGHISTQKGRPHVYPQVCSLKFVRI